MNLPAAAAGQNIVLRWRMGSDTSTGVVAGELTASWSPSQGLARQPDTYGYCYIHSNSNSYSNIHAYSYSHSHSFTPTPTATATFTPTPTATATAGSPTPTPTCTPGVTLYGISNGFGTPEDNQIYQIDPATGTISNAHQVTLAGFTVGSSQAMAARPGDGVLFAVIQTTEPARRLVTINPNTGVATSIGVLTNQISSLAFRSTGTLWAVSGDGGSPAETLYTVNTSNAALTLQFALGNGADGETIAFHGNGLMYHSSGNASAMFESVNVDTQVVTPIGTASPEMFGMGYNPTNGQLYGSDIASDLFTIDIATGVRTLIGVINGPNDTRGLAFVSVACPSPTPTPTATAASTSTPTATATFTPTASATFTPTPTATATFTPTPTPTPTATCGQYTITQIGGSIVPGTTDSGNHGDDQVTAVALPFSFTLYDQTFNSINVSSNGPAQFTTTDTAFTNICPLPWTTHNYTIFPYWDDQRTDANAGCAGFPGGYAVSSPRCLALRPTGSSISNGARSTLPMSPRRLTTR